MKKTTVSVPPLFGHQEEARALTLAELDVSDRCKVIMACGTGKTRIGPELAMARDARTVVVYLPSLALMRQTLPDWINAPFVGGSPDILCVCSDSTVADSDAPVVTASELAAEFHKPVTTSSDEVRGFLAAPSKHVRVVFSTYQSSDVVSAGCPDGFAFDMGLFDEAHRTAGKDSAFSGPLLDAHTWISKRVFMTATPKHFNLRKKAKKEAKATVAYSMDDESSYGRVAYRLPIREAIKRGIIADYQVLITVVDDKTIAEKLKARKSKESIEQIAHAFAIKDAMSKYGVTKVVTFHDSVKNAQQFAENAVIQQELGVPTFHVNGSIPTRDRAGIMQQFAATPQALVTNAKCLTEGVDVPAIDMVAFLHPKKSKIDIIQAIGRALRLPRGSKKTTGYILLPIYVSQIEDGGLEKTLDESGFDSIVQVIQALKEQDEVVEAVFREAAKRSRSEQDSADLGFVKIAGPEVYLNKLRNAITTQCLEYFAESWWAKYGELEKFFQKNGSSEVPFKDDSLGYWCDKQRSYFKSGNLAADKVTALQKLNFRFDVKWQANLQVFKQYLAGEVKRPSIWINKQSSLINTGQISASRLEDLKRIGFLEYLKNGIPQNTSSQIKPAEDELPVKTSSNINRVADLLSMIQTHKNSRKPSGLISAKSHEVLREILPLYRKLLVALPDTLTEEYLYDKSNLAEELMTDLVSIVEQIKDKKLPKPMSLAVDGTSGFNLLQVAAIKLGHGKFLAENEETKNWYALLLAEARS